MTTGVGGSTAETELAKLKSMCDGVEPIALEERQARLAKAQALMRDLGIDALYLDASTSLDYFTGLRWFTQPSHSIDDPFGYDADT